MEPGTSDEATVAELVSNSPEETRAIGEVLGRNARPGDVFLLVGELGAGKTCLTQGVLWGLGVDDYARSPTFVLVSEHHGRLTLYHMDLYRLESVDEVTDLGLDEYLLGDGVSVVEWAEKAPGAFPEAHLMVRIDYVDEDTRRFTFTAGDPGHAELVSAVMSAAVAGRG